MSDNNEQQLDIGSALENATEDQLNQAETFEDFMAQQQNSEPQEPEQNVEPEQNNTESESNPNSEESDEGTTEDTETPTETELSDADFRKAVTAVFRANHQDVQVDNPDDIRKLMQFGMNYHKKMGELAPHRKILKSLEQNGLLEADKINFAIDLLKGDKVAVAKFLKDQSIDTYDLPDLDETPYESKNYIPTDERIRFEDKQNEYQQTEEGRRVLEYIKNLDQDSFYDVYSNPVILDNLKRHSDIGLMQDTLATLEKEYALGNVPANVKPLDAYAFVAEQLEKQNPTKYNPNYQQPKVLGNNLNQQSNTTGSKVPPSANIPNNRQAPQPQQSYSGIDTLLNASEEDLAKFDNWEQYLQANNINF